MTEIIIEKKKYFLVPEKELFQLRKKASLKTRPEKTFTLEEARAYSKKQIKKWANAK